MNDFLITRGLVPDFLIRQAIRKRLASRLSRQSRGGPSASERRLVEMVEHMKAGPLIEPRLDPETQLPAAFFEKVLGKHLKRGSGFWREGVEDIHISEAEMLEIISWRADLQDGQRILDLGCGWGAFSLYVARKFPKSTVLAVAFSETQGRYVAEHAKQRGLLNLEVTVSDPEAFRTDRVFDRVVSIEMFQKVQNYQEALQRIAGVLDHDGKLFLHLFCHKKFAYRHEDSGVSDKLAAFFFGNGVVPSEELLLYFDERFRIEQRWRVPGSHYRRTCRTWLERMQTGKKEIMGIFREIYGKDAAKWWAYWRAFFLYGEELFGYNGGGEWFVSHYLFRKK